MPDHGGAQLGHCDEALAETGARLARAVVAAVPGWVQRSVTQVLGSWEAAGGTVRLAGGTPAVLVLAQEAGRRAAAQLEDQLTSLLAADVDAQWTTPLSMVRALVVYPTTVLSEAGVAPLERDRFAQERFPDDRYALTPASLAAFDPEVAELAMWWGAAKAAAHRARHQR